MERCDRTKIVYANPKLRIQIKNEKQFNWNMILFEIYQLDFK